MIEEVLEEAAEESLGVYEFWLADCYDNLSPEDHYTAYGSGTVPPIDLEWRSPFLGKTLEDASEFVRGAPRNGVLNLEHLVVLNKSLYSEKGWLTAYKFCRGGVPVPLPLIAKYATCMLSVYHYDMWKHYVEDYYRDGRPANDWGRNFNHIPM